MTANKLVKSVSFNITNATDAKILKAIKRRKNFSGYVKKLLLADIEAREKAIERQVESVVESKPTSNDRLAQLKEQMKNPKLTD
jgi:hypothetical protein